MIALPTFVLLFFAILSGCATKPSASGEASTTTNEINLVTRTIRDMEVSFRLANSKDADQSFQVLMNPVTEEQEDKVRFCLDLQDDTRLKVDGGRRIVYSAATEIREGAEPMDLTEEQAITRAKEYLISLGLMQDEDYILSIWPVTGETNTIMMWDVGFYHTYDELPVLSDKEWISLRFNSKGITNFTYQWNTYIPLEQQETQKALISDAEALEFYITHMETDTVYQHQPIAKEIQYQQAYVYKEEENTLYPCWVFSSDKEFLVDAVCINAETGELERWL